MFGHPYQHRDSGSVLDTTPAKVGRIRHGNTDLGEVSIRTAALADYPTVLLVRKSDLVTAANLAKECIGTADLDVLFDHRVFTFHRSDVMTGDVVLVPLHLPHRDVHEGSEHIQATGAD